MPLREELLGRFRFMKKIHLEGVSKKIFLKFLHKFKNFQYVRLVARFLAHSTIHGLKAF